MKKILLGTTALVTAGLLAGPALASDPLKVTVGGNVVTGFYFVDADHVGGTASQDTKVALVARNIDIKAEGTLDNGLVAGVDAKLQLGSDWNANNVQNGSANFRQLFAYLEGGFGKFEIGGTDGAAYKMHYTSPWFVPGNGVDSPNIYNGVSSKYGYNNYSSSPEVRLSTFSLMATDSNKISYFTPRLAGFQLGLSYTPDAQNHGPSENGLVLLPKDYTNNPYDYNNINQVFEIALNYAGTFGGVDVGVDGFYTGGNAMNNVNADPEEYGLGANLGYAGFTLGGAWYQSNDLDYKYGISYARKDAGAEVWTVGLKYATGPWTVGIAYLDGQDNSDGGLGNYRDGRESQTVQLGGGYNLGSGVDIGLDLQWASNQHNDSWNSTSYDTKSGGLVLAIAF
ncbi:porin [Parvibaculum sedimenti]|uniref:Porin n=1 Tax=Parvibaculum sedimenti TaxID=2608632 RepID=A0A6N6VD65_9HYPH|nr:porin [Parvibaculum sedimenti]KAB7738510.1 porin [Parvibaculum sedimenti]